LLLCRLLPLGCQLCPPPVVTPSSKNGSEYIFETSIQPIFSAPNSKGSGCTLICWTEFYLSQAMAVPDSGPPSFPIQCDVDIPCGGSASSCVDITADGGSFTSKVITSSVRIRYVVI
jgi:hypothetical protein